MRAIAITLASVVLALGVAACGSKEASNTTSSSAHEAGTTAREAATTAEANGKQAEAEAARYTDRLRELLGKASTDAGKLAGSSGSAQQAARTRLQDVQREASALAAEAQRRLPAGEVRETVVKMAQQTGHTATALASMHAGPQLQAATRTVQGALAAISAALHELAGHFSGATARQVGSGLEQLAGTLEKEGG
jgi:hypothetical protein